MDVDSTVQTTQPATPRVGVNGLVDALFSLQCKATILVVATTLAVTAGASSYLLRSSIGVLHTRQDRELIEVATILARASGVLLENGDRDALQTLARGVADGAPLDYVVITDVGGHTVAGAHTEIVAAFDRAGAAVSAIPGEPVLRKGDDGSIPYLDVVFPINISSELRAEGGAPARLLGYLRAGLTANTWQRTIASTLDLLVGVGSLCILVAIPLGFLIVRRIVSPLEDMAGLMERLSRGQLSVRAATGSRDEIGRLGVAFNRMADQHQETHERIVRLNAELERRVAQRTRQLSELAAREPLTSLYNRRRFNEVLERGIAEAVRYDNMLSCIMMDLDDFKQVNDAFGHAAGDQVLVLAADTIRRELRSSDVPARLGGDEFVILLPQTGGKRAHVLAERIGQRFVEELRRTMPEVRTGMSMGIASLESVETADAESLLRAADRALYEAKAGGKNAAVTAKPAAV